MGRIILGSVGVGALCLAVVLIAEGANAVLRWQHLDGSITYNAYLLLKTTFQRPRAAAAAADPPYTRMLTRSMMDPLIPKLKTLGAAVGNSPYDDLVTAAAALNTVEGGCIVQKPNLRKTMTYLRTNMFNPLDPPTLFYDTDKTLDADTAALVREYGLRQITYTTNARGERTTVPPTSADRVVLIAGDSVANGSMVGDAETLASQMQARDPTRRYINLGIGNAAASDIVCALERAAERYGASIDELIYVYCENDFEPEQALGHPDAVLDWLSGFVRDAYIGKVIVVYAPFIYNIVPQLTRFRGYRRGRAKTFAEERAQLRQRVVDAGFGYLDIAEVALAEIERRKTQFAALSLFVDHIHLSPYGTARVIDALERARTR